MKKNKDNLRNMACLDLFLTSLSPVAYEQIKDSIEPISSGSPLLSMDIYSQNFQQSLLAGRRKNDLETLLNLGQDVEWEFDHNLILENNYDALVLTDAGQTIKWVNKGFSKMTGYAAGYAIGKTPRFLQGEETVFESRNRIREKLKKTDVFTETVINYRKNGDTYKCEITVIPLINKRLDITHFLAIEKEVA